MNTKIAKMISALVIGAMIVAVLPMKTAAASPQDTLVVGMQDDAGNLCWFDPDTNDVWKTNILQFDFEGLMAYTPDFRLYPVLAAPGDTDEGADWSSTDGLNITFNIRQGVTFTDGTAMTAKDVAFSFQVLGWGLFQTTVANPLLWETQTWTAFDGRSSKTHIGVEAVDDDTVIFHLPEAYSMFWYGTLTTPIIPSHIWEDHLVALDSATLGDFGIAGATEYQLDYTYGVDDTEKDATIGTGPWMLNYWTEGVGAQIDVYEGYWGKNATVDWGGVDYPMFPKYLKHIQYKQYGALDVAILALRKGEIHYIPWNIGAGFYNSLKTDPNIGFQIPQDQGLFYMAFNFRKSPMSDLAFRKAISFAVDKDYIVNRLMGGYGTKGTVPIAVTNPFYINQTVPDYIAGLNLDKAKAALDAAGYTDKNSDGWRENKDGTPLKLSILTPPKDYDPVRADSGIMISKNLKSIGLNIDSAPTSFDTIVSKAFVSYDFDIYVLGWSVGSFPENYLYDFFHSDADVATNPAGSNSMGYSNPQVDQWIEDIATTMDNNARAKLVKDVCGKIMEDVGYDTLYYRKNIEAFKQSSWQGWTPAFGTCWNGFSLNSMHSPGTGGGGGVAPGPVQPGALYLRVGLPDYTPANSAVTAQIYASQDNMPVSGVNLVIDPSYAGANITKTTDASGYAEFTSTVPFQSGLASFNIIGTKGTLNATAFGSTTVVITPVLAQLNLSCSKPVIDAGQTTTITAWVCDESRAGISNVAVDIDKTLVLGQIAPAAGSNRTGSTGCVNFTYTAPGTALLPNTGTMDIIKAFINVPDTLVPEVQSASIIIGVENPLNSSWTILDVKNVTSFVMDNSTLTTTPRNVTINLTVSHYNGTKAAGKKVDISLSNASIAKANITQATSNAWGNVSFNLTCFKDPVGSTLQVSFKVNGTSYATKETVSLIVNKSSTGYGAVAHYSSRAIADSTSTTLRLTLYNNSNMPAKNVPVAAVIPSTDFGMPSYFDDGAEIPDLSVGSVVPYLNNIDTEDGDFENIGSGMWYNLTLPAGNVTDAVGMYNMTITAYSWANDQAVQPTIYYGPNLVMWADGNMWVAGFHNYSGSITSGYVQHRAPLITMGKVQLDKGYMTKEANYGKITATFYNKAGPIDASKVRFYDGKGSSKKALTYEKANSGVFTYYITPTKSDSSSGAYYTFLNYNGAYSYGDTVQTCWAAGTLVSTMPFEITYPYIYTPQALVLSGKAGQALVAKGGSTTFTLAVTDLYGTPVEGATVYGGGSYNLTNASGECVLEEVVGDAGINTYKFSAVSGYATGSIELATFGGITKFAFSSPSYPVNMTVGEAATFTVSVQNTGPVPGDAKVDLIAGGAVVQSKVVSVTANGGEQVSFTYIPTANGTMSFSFGGAATTTSQSVTATSLPPPEVEEEGGYDIMIVALAAIAMLVVGLLIGFVLAKMMGGKGAAPKETPKREIVEEPAEESEPPVEEEQK
jgi:uncharacterized repeat protein (TIGR01451 family)